MSFVFLYFRLPLGEGPRIFEQMGINTLKLLDTKTFSSGAVAHRYQPQEHALERCGRQAGRGRDEDHARRAARRHAYALIEPLDQASTDDYFRRRRPWINYSMPRSQMALATQQSLQSVTGKRKDYLPRVHAGRREATFL